MVMRVITVGEEEEDDDEAGGVAAVGTGMPDDEGVDVGGGAGVLAEEAVRQGLMGVTTPAGGEDTTLKICRFQYYT